MAINSALGRVALHIVLAISDILHLCFPHRADTFIAQNRRQTQFIAAQYEEAAIPISQGLGYPSSQSFPAFSWRIGCSPLEAIQHHLQGHWRWSMRAEELATQDWPADARP